MGLTHEVHSLFACAESKVDAGRVVAAVALLQLQHAEPELLRLVGAHVLAAADR